MVFALPNAGMMFHVLQLNIGILTSQQHAKHIKKNKTIHKYVARKTARIAQILLWSMDNLSAVGLMGTEVTAQQTHGDGMEHFQMRVALHSLT